MMRLSLHAAGKTFIIKLQISFTEERAVILLILYSATVFLSAFLIFLVQPMIGKMILPLVGGAPAAWNSCLLFFQTLMLAGYSYAHFSIRRLGLYRQALTHLLLMLVALILLPISFDRTLSVPEDPSLWLIIRLFESAGMPFFVLAAISPMLQLWFSRTGHARADNPYFLFAASNLGSFAALLLYPVFVEPVFNLEIQARIWAGCFVLLLLLLIACRLKVQAKNTTTNAVETKTASPDKAIQSDSSIRFKWLVAALFPSALLLAVTQFITSDIAPIPLLWVIPLAIYLVTYVMAFSEMNLSAAKIESLFLVAILVFPAGYFNLQANLWVAVPLHLFILFAISLYCHSYLAKNRPEISELTGFYAIISLGGVIGSLLITFAAPAFFSNDSEYPLLIIMVCYLNRRFSLYRQQNGQQSEREESLALTIIMGCYVAAVFSAIGTINFARFLQQNVHSMGFDPSIGYLHEIILFLVARHAAVNACFLICAAVLPLFILKKMPQINLALFCLISIGLMAIWHTGNTQVKLYSSRNFFSIKKVTISATDNTIVLVHGSTMHGTQSLLPEKQFEPLAYFHKNGPIGSIFALDVTKKPDFKAAILGLGIGSLLAYAQPGQEFSFYEIDPDVIKIAQNPDYFSYLTAYKDRCRVICGDGRRAIEQSPTGYFDIIFVDAFSSDSIPVHLVTREALQVYFDRLQPDGAIVLNATNRYIDLKHVLAALARHGNYFALHALDNVFDKNDPANFGRNVSEYVIFTRSQNFANELKKCDKISWQNLTEHVDHDNEQLETFLWTDNSSRLFPLLRLFR